ncbi:MAG: iron ABC transporter permease [Spirochaetia bacterium]|jgi:iron(III) transport system permease protein|nr:iron ABC transporter permease [Spirochaetia bacterium]
MSSIVSLKSGSPFWRKTVRELSKPEKVMGLILIAVLVFFVLMPAINLVITSFSFSLSDRRLPEVVDRGIKVVPGSFTLVHLERVFFSKLTKKMFLIPLWNSLVVTAGLTVISMLIGCLLAYLVVRTNLPFKKKIANVAMIPYIIPSWPIALAWINIFKNSKIGGSPGWFEYLFKVTPPDWISYGAVPIIICLSLHYYAFAFITVSGALASIDSQLEETAALLGASRSQVIRKITLPLVLPAILSAFILTFSKGLGTFGTSAFLGLPVRYFTLATQIYSNVKNNLAGDAYLIAIVMIIISSLTIYMNVKVIGARKSFVTISGKGFRSKPMDLGKYKWIIFAVVVIFLILAVFLPLYVLTWQTLMETSGDYSLSNFTLHYWIGEAGSYGRSGTLLGEGQAGILRDSEIYRTAWNTIRLSIVVAILAAVIGLFLGYAIVRGRGTKIATICDTLSFAPYIFPGIAFGAVYLSMFSKRMGPIPALYGTFTLLVLVSLAKRLPFSSRTGSSAMMQVDKSLEEAATIVGAGFWSKFKRIIYPLTRSGFVAGFLLSFITTMRELSLIVLLVTPSNKVLTTMVMRYTEGGYHQYGNAITMLVVVLSMSGTILIKLSQGKDLAKGVAE